MKKLQLFAAPAAFALFLSACSATGSSSGEPNAGYTIALIAIVFLSAYFMFMRPEMKRRRSDEDMKSNLQIGDRVTTVGGISGKIREIQKDIVILESGPEHTVFAVYKTGIASDETQKAIAENQKKLDREARKEKFRGKK